MKKLSLFFLLTVFSLSLFACNHELVNLDSVKQQLIQYHDSGRYQRDITTTIDQAMAYLKSRLAHDHLIKPAIVLDIDETSLSNYTDMAAANFGGTFDQIQAAEMQGHDPVIAPTLKLYQYAKAHGVAVFFITGRFENERHLTAENLRKAGYANWDALYLKPENYRGKSAAIYKTAIRKEITNKGYDIILNIGDQQSDLSGGYADKTFKLPNPYYFIG
jgi:acid phosphatase